MSQILRNCVLRAAGLRQASANVTPAMRQQQRSIAESAVRSNIKEPVSGPPKPTTPQTDSASLRSAYRPNKFEQRMLVWTKKYKSLSEVPAHVSPETMEYCRNKMRIRVANYMAIGTVIACILMIYSGKQAAQRGESVGKRNIDWHNQYNAENTDQEPKKA